MAQEGPGLHPWPRSSLVGTEYIVNQCQCVGSQFPFTHALCIILMLMRPQV